MSTPLPSPVPTWTEAFRVRAYEVGADGKLRITNLCDFLQEAAGNHASLLGAGSETLREQGLAWILNRFRLEVSRLPSVGETISIETWPSGSERLLAYRDFAVTSEAQSDLASCLSAWLLMDIGKRRPARLPEWIARLEPPGRPRALPGGFPEAPAPAELLYETHVVVMRADIDVNRHANNVRFIEWALEAVPGRSPAWEGLRSIDISFRAEALLGDRIRVQTFATDPRATGNLTLAHLVSDASTGRLLASAFTCWESPSNAEPAL